MCTLALLIPLYIIQRRAKKQGAFATYQSPVRLLGARQLVKESFWYLDVVGILLLIAFLALILTPFTIAHGVQSEWKTAKVIAPLAVGVCCIPAWIVWERKCKHPMVPFKVWNQIIYGKEKRGRLTRVTVVERSGCLGRLGNCCHAEYW